MLSRLNPISAVRFLVFLEIALILFPGWPPMFNKWEELNTALERSYKKELSGIQEVLTDFDQASNQPANFDRSRIFFNRADTAYIRTNELIYFIDTLKSKLINSKKSFVSQDEYADTIKLKINKLFQVLLNSVSTDNSIELSRRFTMQKEELIQQGFSKNGEVKNKKTTHEILVLLSSVQNFMVLYEAEIIHAIYQQGYPFRDCIFDNLDAIAVPRKSYITIGELNTAKIIVVAYNETIKPELTFTSGTLLRTENGIASWYDRPGTIGEHIVSGTATIKMKDTFITRPWSFQYFVGKAETDHANIQVDSTMVCYRGVPNPVTITAPDYHNNRLDLHVSGAQVKKITDGHYEILVDRDCSKILTADLTLLEHPGKIRTIYSIKIQVKELPAPLPCIGNNTGGYLDIDYLKQHQTLTTTPLDSDFTMHYQITGFEFTFIRKGETELVGPYTFTGAELDTRPEIKNAIALAKPGDRMLIQEITARDENGRDVPLTPISYLLK